MAAFFPPTDVQQDLNKNKIIELTTLNYTSESKGFEPKTLKFPSNDSDNPVIAKDDIKSGNTTVSIQQEMVIKDLNGIVLKVDDEFVVIKLETDFVVNFPKILFKDKKFIKYGQPIKYLIKQDFKGYRYQDFEPYHESTENPLKDEIEQIAKDLK